jgi:hypothetical protein
MANSDTKTQPWYSERVVVIQFRELSANFAQTLGVTLRLTPDGISESGSK